MKKILITGATDGIGASIANCLIDEAHLILVSHNKDKLEKKKNELLLKNQNGCILPVCQDLTEENFEKNILDKCLSNEMIPNILINNFGLYPLDRVDDENFSQKMMNTIQQNLRSAAALVDIFLPFMKKNQAGKIIQIGSQLCKNVRKEAASYTISKHALYAYHKLLLETLKPYHIHSTIILPGSTNTASWDNASREIKAQIIQPEGIAALVRQIVLAHPSLIPDEVSIIASNPNWT